MSKIMHSPVRQKIWDATNDLSRDQRIEEVSSYMIMLVDFESRDVNNIVRRAVCHQIIRHIRESCILSNKSPYTRNRI